MSHFPVSEPPPAAGSPGPLTFDRALWTGGLVFASVSGVIDCKSSAAQLVGNLPSRCQVAPDFSSFALIGAMFFPVQVITTIVDGYGVGLNTPTINVGFTGANYQDWCSTAAIGKITGGAISAMITTGQYATTQIKSTNRYGVALDNFSTTPIYAKMQTVSDATRDNRVVTVLGYLAGML